MKAPLLAIGLAASAALALAALGRTVADSFEPSPSTTFAATMTLSPGLSGTADDRAAATASTQAWSGDWIAKLSTGDCRGIASGDRTWCDTNDCKGIASGDRTWCDSADCRGVASKDRTWCETSLCKGWATQDRTWCDTNDCKGVASKDRTWCDSAQCKAIASGDRTWCP